MPADIAPTIVCLAPAGQLDGADAFRGFMGPFAQILTRSELIAAFGDADTAVLIYDTDTIPGIRLVDPNVVSPTFKQIQSVKSYYGFPDALDVDRYDFAIRVRLENGRPVAEVERPQPVV